MPELPEVETIVRDIRPNIIGKIISGMIIKEKCIQNMLQTSPRAFYEGTIGQAVVTVLRKGKYIILPLSNDNVLIMHLGMTGKLLLTTSPDMSFEERLTNNDYIDKHTHFIIEFMDLGGAEEFGVVEDIELHFNDVRMFGNIWLLENVEDINKLDIPGLRELGPDALGISFQEFQSAVASKRTIKSILLDQTRIAGVGNIYADEALFSAHIHPSTKGILLTDKQKSRLWFAVKSVLKQGLKYRGSSVSNYATADGSKGSFQNYHRVYGKTGKKCVDCKNIIEKIKLVGRSTHFCPSCQRKGANE